MYIFWKHQFILVLGVAESTFTSDHIQSSFHVIFLMQMVKSGSYYFTGYTIIFWNDAQAVVAATSHVVAVYGKDKDLS